MSIDSDWLRFMEMPIFSQDLLKAPMLREYVAD